MNNINTTCIITGCAGFIGSHLTEECLSRGWYVYGIDKLAPFCSHPEFMEELARKYPNQFRFECRDINDIKRLPDIDVIFNICAESHVDNSIEDSHEFLKSNIMGVHNLLELIRVKRKRPLFYQMSTDEVYGDAINCSHTEKDNYNPSNPYSFSKASADLMIKAFCRTYGIEYKIGRATNTWGIRQNTEKLIPKVCQYLRMDKKIPLHNYGMPIRTWLHVNDCVDGILTIIERGDVNDIYNIGGNYEIQNWKIVAKIANILNVQPSIIPSVVNAISPSGKGVSSSNNKIEIWGLSKNEMEGNYYSYGNMTNNSCNLGNICDFSYHRDGQDIRYSLDDSKLRALGWTNKCEFDKALPSVVEYYKSKFVW